MVLPSVSKQFIAQQRIQAKAVSADNEKYAILAIRDTGLTNMFDVPMVQRLAYERGYYELVCYLEEHRKEYAHFIMTGEAD